MATFRKTSFPKDDLNGSKCNAIQMECLLKHICMSYKIVQLFCVVNLLNLNYF